MCGGGQQRGVIFYVISSHQKVESQRESRSSSIKPMNLRSHKIGRSNGDKAKSGTKKVTGSVCHPILQGRP